MVRALAFEEAVFLLIGLAALLHFGVYSFNIAFGVAGFLIWTLSIGTVTGLQLRELERKGEFSTGYRTLAVVLIAVVAVTVLVWIGLTFYGPASSILALDATMAGLPPAWVVRIVFIRQWQSRHGKQIIYDGFWTRRTYTVP